MNRSFPRRVVLYSILGEGDWRPRAEFNLTDEGEIELAVNDVQGGGALAQKYFDRGVPDESTRTVVTRQDPQAFMNALIRQRNESVYRWVDESDVVAN